MKRPMLTLSTATVLTLSGPVLAGPPPGHHFYRAPDVMRRTNPRPRPPVVQQSNTAVSDPTNFLWGSGSRRAVRHKFRRIFRIREPTQ